MSALDKAFLKAYSKDQRAAGASPARPPASSRRPDAARAKTVPSPANAGSSADPYVAGTWYRLEPAEVEADETEALEAEAQASANTGRNRRRFGIRAPHVKFHNDHNEPSTPVEAAPIAPPQARTPKSSPVRSIKPVALPEVSPDPVAESVDEVEPLTPDMLSALCLVTTTGSWDAPLTPLLPVEAPRAPAPAEPAVVIKSYEIADEPARAEPPARPETPASPAKAHQRFDPPVAAAINKPHFPLPAVSQAGEAVEKAPKPKNEPAAIEKAAEGKAEAAPVSQQTVEQAPVVQPSVAQPAIPAISTFEPAWEVERFAWPTACDELLASALDDWGLAVRQLLAAAKQGCKTLAIAGLRRGEGRSTLALCLARLAAQTGAQIALVDADFENPGLAGLLGVGTECDWRTALADGLPLTEASIICLADQLTLIPLQHGVPFKQTSFGRPGVAAMLKSAASAFDLVLVDAGPIAGPEHAACWGGSACPLDGVLLVRDLRRTDAEEAAATVAHLRRSGRERVVVLENFVGSQRT